MPNVVKTLKQWVTVILSSRNGSSSCIFSKEKVVFSGPSTNVQSAEFPMLHRLFIAGATPFSSRTKLQNTNERNFSAYPRTMTPLRDSKLRILRGLGLLEIDWKNSIRSRERERLCELQLKNSLPKKTSPAMRTRLCEIFDQAELTGSVALRFSLYHPVNQGLPKVRMGWVYRACCSS